MGVVKVVGAVNELHSEVMLMESDIDVARELARSAGSMLSILQADSMRRGVAPETLRDEADTRAQELLSAGLSRLRPADCVLSEEAADDSRRMSADRVWIIDPLDGTREFSEGRSDWAVHVALWSEGALSTAAVALPALGLILDSAPAHAVTRVRSSTPVRLAVSRSRPSELVGAVAQAMGAELLPMGSAGFKVSAVIRGEADAYLHSGGQYEWDSAAPVAVARSGGFHASRIDGSELKYNSPNPYLPDLLVCRPELADRLLETIQSVQ